MAGPHLGILSLVCTCLLLVPSLPENNVASARSSSMTNDDKGMTKELKEDSDGFLFEGDMLLDKQQLQWLKEGLISGTLDDVTVLQNITNGKENRGTQRNAIKDPRRRWPSGIVYYSFDRSVTPRRRTLIRITVSNLQNKLSGCLKFQERSYGKRVVVTSNTNGCSSYVGFKHEWSYQPLSLKDPGCMTTGIILHEFLHAVGIFHTQSRSDRDKHVTILWDNIRPDKKYNFNSYDANTITHFDLPYDYFSIMHYGQYYWSKNRKITIQTKNPNKQSVIGQRSGVSPGDLQLVRRMYGCSGPVQKGDQMGPGTSLNSGEKLVSKNGLYTLIMQTDCNLVIYKGKNEKKNALWSTQTNAGATGGFRFWFQRDGNLVLYDSDEKRVRWASHTHGKRDANKLIMQNDGNLVLYTKTNGILWASHTEQGPVEKGDQMGPGTRLNSGEKLVSRNGLYTFIMQTDANLVIYRGKKEKKNALWSTQTNAGATGGFTFRFQKDGNLVLYDSDGKRVRWTSRTHGKRDANKLIMQNDGNLVLYTKTNGILWASHTQQG